MNATPRGFSMAIDRTNGNAVVHVVGEVDLATAPQLEAQLLDLASAGTTSITVDMSQTDFLDSTGLHALVVAVRTLREHGGDLTVRSPSQKAIRILELSGFDTVVNVT